MLSLVCSILSGLIGIEKNIIELKSTMTRKKTEKTTVKKRCADKNKKETEHGTQPTVIGGGKQQSYTAMGQRLFETGMRVKIRIERERETGSWSNAKITETKDNSLRTVCFC